MPNKTDTIASFSTSLTPKSCVSYGCRMQLCEAVNTFQNISEPPADVLKEVKSFLSHTGQPCSIDLYSHSPQPDISLHRWHITCIPTSQLLLVFTLPAHRGMARLSSLRWLTRYRVTHPSTNRAQWKATMLIETKALLLVPNRHHFLIMLCHFY